ncbi:hypothetical protein F3Y22_tig00111996pilonHSYRG00255 [Hibiscus syriacus]|uniref:HAT C-terminal dimerisation domain-containing protein n=1 Tax=Hibiscus syriacus TaxID=106335 RepID=A0A6A2YA35_HIBSY|nr:hypothetical protein F3Y22_tig00111996pilonHSYRG00255 [Hibiscus syriacus]
MLRADAETPCDPPNNSNDAVKTDLSAAASSSIQSNLQRPLNKTRRQVSLDSKFPLDAALKFETAFDMLGEQDFKYRDEFSSSKMKVLPTDLDWEHANALLPFLRAFYDATLKLSDHRHKMDYVIFVIEEVYDAKKVEQLSEIVKQTLNELFDHYSLLSGKSQDEPSVASQSNVSRVKNEELLDLFAYSKTKYKRKRAESVFSEGKSKLENYLEDKVEPDVKKFDLLDWWKNKSQTYPIISLMALDILAILISTVASEYAFSIGGRVLDSFQSSLTKKYFECLICVQNWLRASPVAIQKEEQIKEIEKIVSGFEDLRLNETMMTIDD